MTHNPLTPEHALSPELLRDKIHTLELLVDSATTRAAEGKSVDIKTLQQAALEFCEDVLRLQASEAKNFQSAIADIIRKLDALEKALQDRFDKHL